MKFLIHILFLSLYTLPLEGQVAPLSFQEAFVLNDLNRVDVNFDLPDWRGALDSVNLYADAQITINEYEDIPVRIARKGNSSNNNTLDRDKIPFKIDGPQGLNFKLNNNYRDYTMGAREYIGYKLHQSFAGIGPNIAPTEVYVNNNFYGLYLAVEDLNRRFYDRNLGEISHRIKASPTGVDVYNKKPYSNLYWLGENAQHYEGRYEIKKGSVEGLIDLIDVINNNPGEAYKYIDIEQVCKFLVVENFLMNVDGIIGEVYSHNYELVKRSYDEKWQLVPWDLNLSLGAWSGPSIVKDEQTIDKLTQLPLTSGRTNNALIEMIMDEYYFLYHQYYIQLLAEVTNEELVSWAKNYQRLIRKSKQKDNKLYDSSLQEIAYSEDINTKDGYVTALIPTINKRYSYVQALSLDKKFTNKIVHVSQTQDTVFILVSPEVKDGSVVIEYIDSGKVTKKLRALPLTYQRSGYFCVLPKEVVSYYVYTVFNEVKYSFPFNGILDPLSAGSFGNY